MDKSKLIDLDPPRFEDGERLCIAGFGARYSFEASEGIPNQWRRFGPHIGHVPGQLTPQTYGVAFNFDDAATFTYVAGVRVRDFSETPGEFATVVIEPRRYAVFKHNGHVIGLHRSHYTIMNDWAPKNEFAIASAPNFELYHRDFDPVTGLGTIEIWMPLGRAFESPWRADSEARRRSTNCQWSLEYLATTSAMAERSKPGGS